jgi:hypothetical protein
MYSILRSSTYFQYFSEIKIFDFSLCEWMNASHIFYILFLSVRPFYITYIMAELVVPMSVSVLEDNIPKSPWICPYFLMEYM